MVSIYNTPAMKSTIHPVWHDDALVTCSCGNSFKTGSTKTSIAVDICNQCHPFFTGEMKFVDVQGRVEKFQAKMDQAKKFQATVKAKKENQRKRRQAKSLKEMLTKTPPSSPQN